MWGRGRGRGTRCWTKHWCTGGDEADEEAPALDDEVEDAAWGPAGRVPDVTVFEEEPPIQKLLDKHLDFSLLTNWSKS